MVIIFFYVFDYVSYMYILGRNEIQLLRQKWNFGIFHKQHKQCLYELAFMLQPKLIVLERKSSPKLFLRNQPLSCVVEIHRAFLLTKPTSELCFWEPSSLPPLKLYRLNKYPHLPLVCFFPNKKKAFTSHSFLHIISLHLIFFWHMETILHFYCIYIYIYIYNLIFLCFWIG